MKTTLKLLFILSLVVIVKSCYYDVEEELYPCAASDNVTYSSNIVAILSSNCYSCHSSAAAPSLGSGIVLDSYADLKVKVDDGKFACAVNHESGCSPMPKGGSKLSSCLLTEINTWLSEGAPNN